MRTQAFCLNMANEEQNVPKLLPNNLLIYVSIFQRWATSVMKFTNLPLGPSTSGLNKPSALP